MDLLNIIFHIGVVLAVYNFLWWLIILLLKVLRGGRKKTTFEVYFVKIFRYSLLCDVIFLFLMNQNEGNISLSHFLLSGLILLFYFVGKIQKKQQRQSLFGFDFKGEMPQMAEVIQNIRPIFNLRWEVLTLVIAFVLYGVLFVYPSLANNFISAWFVENIQGIIEAPVFGFIFKVIGFFFLFSVVMKVVNSITALLLGTKKYPSEEGKDDFDDYIEEN